VLGKWCSWLRLCIRLGEGGRLPKKPFQRHTGGELKSVETITRFVLERQVGAGIAGAQ
jgi:hypothetical protein